MHALFNQVAKKLTGIDVDLVRDTAAGVTAGQSVGGVDPNHGQVEVPAEDPQARGEPFKLGQRPPADVDGSGKKKKKKGCC